ncbi:MAG TPA: type II secretion system protein GspN [Candidatus Manganitrophaceae bacterium]
MKTRKKRGGLFLGYTLFAFLMFLLFLYWTFPFDLLQSKLILSLEEATGCQMEVGEKKIRFPLRLAWGNVRGRCPQGPMAQWEIESIDAHLSLLPLLWSRRGEIDFQVRLAGGMIAGRLAAVRKGGRFFLSIKEEGKRLDLARLGPGMSGLLHLEGDGNWIDRDFLKGEGALSFTFEEVRAKEIGKWPIPIGEIAFSNIRGKVRWRNGMVTIEQFAAQGPEADLDHDGGNLLIRVPLEVSLLSLNLKVTPKGNLKQLAPVFVQNYSDREPLKVGVNGPLNQLKFLVNGVALNL